MSTAVEIEVVRWLVFYTTILHNLQSYNCSIPLALSLVTTTASLHKSTNVVERMTFCNAN